MSGRRAHGTATIEFLLAVGLGLMPILGALFELSQLGTSRQVLQVAAFDAVRAAAVAQADRSIMTRALARGVVPLFALRAESAPAAYGRALLAMSRPDLTRIDILRPTRAAFDDFAVGVPDDRLLPNAGTALIARRGASSGLSLAQANDLIVEIRYCRQLVVPLLDRLLVAIWAPLATPDARVCLAQRRVPLVVRAATVMQSPVSARRSGIQ